MDFNGDELLECPICGYRYAVSVEDSYLNDGKGVENAYVEQCDGCNELFKIIDFDDHFSVEATDEDEEETNEDNDL